jgi:hypothetical protein
LGGEHPWPQLGNLDRHAIRTDGGRPGVAAEYFSLDNVCRAQDAKIPQKPPWGALIAIELRENRPDFPF